MNGGILGVSPKEKQSVPAFFSGKTQVFFQYVLEAELGGDWAVGFLTGEAKRAIAFRMGLNCQFDIDLAMAPKVDST